MVKNSGPNLAQPPVPPWWGPPLASKVIRAVQNCANVDGIHGISSRMGSTPPASTTIESIRCKLTAEQAKRIVAGKRGRVCRSKDDFACHRSIGNSRPLRDALLSVLFLWPLGRAALSRIPYRGALLLRPAYKGVRYWISERFGVSEESLARRKIAEVDLQMGSLSRKREPRNPVRRRGRQDDRSALEARNSHGNTPPYD